MMTRIHTFMRKARKAREDLWMDERMANRRGVVLGFRVLTILWRGVVDNALFSRAAALSYSSLLALAPVLGVIVLFTGSFLKVNPEVHIKKALLFIAPSISQYIHLDEHEAKNGVVVAVTVSGVEGGEAAAAAPTEEHPVALSEQASEMGDAFDILLRRMIEGAQTNLGGINQQGKGIAGAIGGLLLIWIGITLLVAIENALNDIWGVKRGRAWSKRIVLYWAILSLGALSGIILIGLLSATTVAGLLDTLPFGARLTGMLIFIGPIISIVGLTLLLTVFYQFFPNTRVRFLPALAGGIAAASLLVLNNLLSILYINNVIRIQSLYGSMGIVLVLMFGLYLFWAFLLLGGQITFAVQNAQFLANQRAWEHISERTRETITFAAFVLVSRRFALCQPPMSADELAEKLRVPSNILNESLTRLADMGLVTAMDDEGDDGGSERTCFSPARPLRSISMSDFRKIYASHGSDSGAEQVGKVDGLIDLYRRSMDDAVRNASAKNMETLLDEVDAGPPPDADAAKA
ncbi:MAG: YhjD/YihY/BrkB family envelope integrity protein [Opitutales bacterium]|jgi:membrane protein